MIGNDVIDILQSRRESNWKRKGFLEKLFTHQEQLYINNSTDREITVWLLWSMKEAAYKIYNRQTKIRTFIPLKLECTLHSQNTSCATGSVLCFENIYYTKTAFADNAIHTVSVTSLDDLNNVTEIENKGIIKDEHGIPHLFSDIENTYKDISISNHGRFEKVVTLV